MVFTSGGHLSCAVADYHFPLLEFTLLAVHPEAAAQGTALGQTISHITAYEDRLYVGYGDWIADTGPITIRHLDPSSGGWSAPLLNYGTEAITHFRKLGGQLYTTNVDPLLGPGINPGGFAVGTASHAWSAFDTVAATHVFDINQTSNGNLWMVGSNGNEAMVWQSTDGGASFTVQRADALGTQWWEFSRYVGVGVLNDNVYVQRVDPNGAPITESLVFNGFDWSLGPNLLPGSTGYMTRPEEFSNSLIYLDADLTAGYLYKFDGSIAELAFNSLVHDFTSHADSLFVLAAGGEVFQTTDLDSWASLGLIREDARSIAVLDGRLYFGTTESSVWYSNQVIISAVPEPSSWSVLLLFASCVSMRRARRKVLV